MKDNIIREYWHKKIDHFEGINSNVSKENETKEKKTVSITSEYLEGIYALSKNNAIAEYTIYLSIFNTILKKYTDYNYIWTVSPSLKLENVKSNNDRGLIFSVPISNKDTFKNVLNATKLEIEETLSYGSIDFNIIEERLEDKNINKEDYRHYGFNYSPVTNHYERIEDIKLYLNISKTENDELILEVNYDSYLYNNQFIENFINHFINTLKNIQELLSVNVEDIDIVSDEEKKVLLNFSKSDIENSINDSLITLFHKQVESTPNQIALLHREQKYTYAELNQKANQLAYILHNDYAVNTGDFVGIMTDYSADTIVGFLAVLKLGAAYLPIDASIPEERIEYILSDVNPKVILIHLDYLDRVINFEVPLFYIDVMLEDSKEHNILENTPNSNEIAYVMYTSGSTGIPKGVVVKDQGIVRLVKDTNYINIESNDKILAISNPAFDGSTFDIWGALLNGATLVIAEKDLVLNFDLLAEAIIKNKITVSFMTTALFNSLVDSGLNEIGGLRKVLFGGEMVSINHVRKFIERYGENKLIHVYGPTENTTFSTFYPVNSVANLTYTVPIGKPIANTSCYILDKNQKMQPVGVSGELYVGGEGVAAGYLNKKERTLESFVKNPFDENSILYKTGDICKWLPDGNIEFVGRVDNQVKIRGFRIELGEIEQKIISFENIKKATIVISNDANNVKFLSAFFIAENTIDIDNLKAYLASKLPSYMIPPYLTQVEYIPLTRNGKVDQKKLLELEKTQVDVNREIIFPNTETEKKVYSIWKELFNTDDISTTDDFFEIGGHSIKATHLVSMIHKELGAKIRISDVFEARTIIELSKAIDHLDKTNFTEIESISKQESYPTSSSQRRLWTVSQFEEATIAYNVSGTYILKGNLDRLALESSFKTLIERHESLRTIFKEGKDGEPRQHILSSNDYDFNIAYNDFRDLSNQGVELKNKLKTLAETQFDLSKGLLLKVDLIHLEDQKWACNFILHHIISDGLSLEILIKELFTFYNIYVKGDSKMPDPLRVHYKDYVVWQNNQLKDNELKNHQDYWLGEFEGDIPTLNLLGDKQRPKIKTYNGAIKEKAISSTLLSALKKVLQNEDATLFMGLQTAVNILLNKYTNDEDIIIGTQISGRTHIDLKNQIGLYINALPLRTKFKGTDSFRELLQNVKKGTLNAFEHQAYPFDLLIDNLKLKHDISRNPLFDVTVVLQNEDLDQIIDLEKSGEIDIEVYKDIESKVSRFDLSFNFVETQGELLTSIVYNTDIFNESTIHQLLLHFENIVEVISNAPQSILNDINVLTAEETKTILYDFNDAVKEDSFDDKNIVKLFKEQVKKNPHKKALVFNNQELTYKELDYKSDQLAHFLRQDYSIKKGDFVGISLERSHMYVVAILGVLKADAVYVPIDPDYPQKRQEHIISDTAIKVLITQTDYLFDYDFYQGGVFALDVQLNDVNLNLGEIVTQAEGNDLAYVMYTSGSTGTPKGVMIEQKSIVRLVKSTNYVSICEEDNILSLSNFSFDGSTFDIFGALLNGATLHIPLKECFLDYEALGNTINNNKISTFFLTTALFNSLVDINFSKFDSLKYVLFGGERVSVSHVNQFKERYKHVNLVHVYGPTENTTFSTYYKVEELTKDMNTIPIGKGISKSECYILNQEDYRRPMPPIGVVGEIYVGGVGVSRGYLNNPEMTAEKFLPHPYKTNEIIYKTGDLGRWLPDGNIEFIGRVDDQVKIRGHRIELGGIENILTNHKDVVSCVVVAKETKNKDNELIVYYTGESCEVSEFQKHLEEYLPDYMIPKYFLHLDVLPLNSNGKVNKKLLPTPEIDLNNERKVVAPRNETETRLVEIWKEVLDVNQISITDDFFDLGGHSLKITRLISKLHKEFEVKVELKKLFEITTLQNQALLIDKAVKSKYSQIPKVEKLPFYPLSSSQKRLWILSQFEEAHVAYNMPTALEFKGNLNRESLKNAFKDLTERHEILRTVFKENEQGEVGQYVLASEDFNFEISYEDLQNVNNKSQIAKDYLRQDFETNFDLEQGPLLKASLYQVEKDKWIFSYVMHHIISDGWSMDILIKELLETYNSYNKTGRTTEKDELEIQYKDYAVWQQKQLNENKLKTHKEFWLKQFEGELPVLQLPEDKPRPQVQTYNGKTIQARISADLVKKLKHQTNQEGATLFISLLTVVKVLLHRYTNSQDIIIGSPIANREHADLENQIGFYLNTLALRTQFSSTNTFKELLDTIKQNTLEAYKHQIYPFDELINDLKTRRDMSKNALFDVMVVLQNATTSELIKNKEYQVDGLHISNYKDSGYEVSKFDLSFNFLEVNDEIEVEIEYNNDIYSQETAQRMLHHLEQVIINTTNNPNLQIGEVDILNKEEKKLLLENFGATKSREVTESFVIQEFEKAVCKYPEKTALLFEDKIFTYEKLNRRANQLAHYLKENYTVGSDTLIGIELERSEWILISMLAILKTGSAYLPIDVQLPQERIDFMKSDSNCSCIIDKSELLKFEENKEALDNNNLEIKSNKSDLAYLMYTSGSTGTPKGVMIENESMLDYCLTFIETFNLGEADAVIQQSSISFDTHVEEIFPTLIVGGTLLMGTNGGRDIKEIQHLIEEKNATVLSTTPLIMKALNESELNLNKLRLVISGGDKLSRSYISSFFNKVEIYDTYGPTESTVCSTYSRIDNTLENCIIGKPITNRSITITNDNGVLQPIGIIGEIRISGSGLARGYKNEEDLTAEKFVINNDLVREYKTGDLGKWLPNGNIEFIGRKDSQVKIRGYRVELGEIENTLQNYPTIESAAILVVKNEEGIDELVTYLVTGKDFNILEVRRYMNSKLPSYMIPSKYIKIDEMPLNTNGKINKNRLHETEGSLINSGAPFVPARNEIEEALTNMWKEILQKERIGIYDNFFDLGGQSIKATHLINKINESFLVKIKIKKIFEDPTISGISEHVKFMLQQKELQKNKLELQEINID